MKESDEQCLEMLMITIKKYEAPTKGFTKCDTEPGSCHVTVDITCEKLEPTYCKLSEILSEIVSQLEIVDDQE